MLRHVTIGE